MNLVIDDIIYSYQDFFSQFGAIKAIAGRDITNKSVKYADILIIRSRTRVDEKLLNNTRVKFVGSTVAGLDHIDLDYLKDKNIKFAHAAGCNANAVAEFVIYNILHLANIYNFDLQATSLAIIGVGNVGKALQQKAQKLGMQLLLNDPIRQQNEQLTDFVSLEQALTADIISFHTPLSFDGDYPTFNLLSDNNFFLVKDKAIIINAARGGVINEKEWLKKITKANIIDCWENEPYINQQLLQKAYLATPHIAGHSIDAKFKGSYIIYHKLCDFLNIKPKRHKLNIANISNINHTDNLLQTINTIYDFNQDNKALQNGDFENYRKNYPQRYEWQNYGLLL